VPGRAADPGPEDWEALVTQVQVLTEEIRRVKEQLVLPDSEEELESYGGLGPAASKVYGKTSGLSLGGYGEFYFAAPLGDDAASRVADFYRFITYVGYKFNDRVLMNTEIEFEHATTSANLGGKSGSVSVEFSYLDFLVSRAVNLRAGNLLVPMGFVNEMHEPPFYRGNFRPEIERRLIPSTWRELGVGAYGEAAAGLTYKLYALNGFDAKGFDGNGLRGGRQKGNRALWEDVAGLLALAYEGPRGLTVGGSVFLGESDQNQLFDGEEISALTMVAEGHLELRQRGFQGRALVAITDLDDAEAIARDLSEEDSPVAVPERQIGWYVEGAYDVSRWVGLPAESELLAWIRYEDYDLQETVPRGFAADPRRNAHSWVFGLEWKPHPSVVVKGDFTRQENKAGGDTENPLRIGAGFVF
jgi:hypothetical protein